MIIFIKNFIKKNKLLYKYLFLVKKLLSYKFIFILANKFNSTKMQSYKADIEKWKSFNDLLVKKIKNTNGKLNFLNLGSGLGEVSAFTVFQNNELNYDLFFKKFNYYTLDYFALDLNKIQNNGDSVIRPDQQEKLVNIDKNIFKEYPLNFHTGHIIHDLNIEFEKKEFFNFFDFVYCENVLEHVNNPSQVFDTFSKILKKNGIGYVSTPFSYPYHQDPEDYWRFTHKGLKFLLENKSKENFEIIFCGYSTEDRRKKLNLNDDLFSFWIESWFSVIIFKKL